MPNNIVFLSHSSQTPEALADVEELGRVLDQQGFRVRLDRRIKGGVDWNVEIDQWLHECGAAVVLLSPDALDSKWVFKEVSVLQSRRQVDPHLKVVPVVISSATKKAFLESKDHEPLKLDALQILEEENATKAAGRIIEALGPAAPLDLSVLEQVAEEIAELLSALPPLAFERIFRRLKMDLPPWRSGSGYVTTLARALASCFLGKHVYEAHHIVDMLGVSLCTEAKAHICHLLSAVWVREEAASLLAASARKTPGTWPVALNGEHLQAFTANAYLRRAFWPETSWHLIPVEGGSGTDTLRHIEESILEYARQRKVRNPDRWLRQTESILVLLPDRSMIDCHGLATLRIRFPRLTFILGTGAALPNLTEEGYTEMTHLEPAVDLKDEDKAHQAFEAAMIKLGIY
ncbi:toll/interleukin-1 receptor domain-containing protein [Corallococcus exiguus]|uniref:toll/interleukin-1 receptor domain-containing protein n=1 Tax=Corallococcus exiguus TaxID=83462 RepID=UPI0014732CC3|nr:toll/interleukin-1 receptor domain-containing protein [Corallococcus exiguus]NNB99630.1 toll/interleukin-1 receptor domain-containing protein [Corallococcus exiguus]